MKKRQLFTVINLAGLVCALLLWVISVATEDAFPGFNFAWASFIATAVWGVSFTVRVFFERDTVLKKSWTVLAGAFYLAAAGSLISALALENKLILPIICLTLAVALLVGSLALGGKKWDEGDNQKLGYKNYYERKEEERLQKEAEKTAEKEDGQNG